MFSLGVRVTWLRGIAARPGNAYDSQNSESAALHSTANMQAKTQAEPHLHQFLHNAPNTPVSEPASSSISFGWISRLGIETSVFACSGVWQLGLQGFCGVQGLRMEGRGFRACSGCMVSDFCVGLRSS